MRLDDKQPSYWIEIASHDHETVKILIKENGPVDVIIYHMHQCVEKLLKAKILEIGLIFPFIHDLKRLSAIILEKCQIPDGVSIALIELQDFQKNLRYPQSDFLGKNDLEKALHFYNVFCGWLKPEMVVAPRQS